MLRLQKKTLIIEIYLGNAQKYIDVPIFSESTIPSSTRLCNTSFTDCATMPFSLGAIFSNS